MGLNLSSIESYLCRVIQLSSKYSLIFINKHPLISSALIFLFTLYLFLSYVYHFLLYMFPFVVCIAIFVTIFWSSEQNLIINVKKHNRKKKKKVESDEVAETRRPNTPIYGRHGTLVKYPSQNATSRRRNFTGRKLDVYGDLEHKAKDLTEVFQNEFSNIMFGKSRSYRVDDDNNNSDFYDSLVKQETPRSRNLISSELPPLPDTPNPRTINARNHAKKEETDEKKAVVEPRNENVLNPAKKEETDKEKAVVEAHNVNVLNVDKKDDTDEKKAADEASQDDIKKSGEVTEDEQRASMDLGLAVTERTKRLENLMVRRRAREQLKLHIEKVLVDIKSSAEKGQNIPPLIVAKVNNSLDSSKDNFDGIEMPGSAPAMRSPFDIPYDPYEEKPNLTGDNFAQEFTSNVPNKDIAFSRHESFFYGSSYQSNRRLIGRGSHDWFSQLSRYGTEAAESTSPNPLSDYDETTHDEADECEYDDIQRKQEEDDDEDEAASAATENNNNVPTTMHKVTQSLIEEIAEDNDSVYKSVPSTLAAAAAANANNNDNKDNQENAILDNNARRSHTPSLSLASDLQVEVSEVGSPTLTVDESHDTVTTTDGESVLYDGDVDRDVTSGSEDMWGASLHARERRRVSEQDISELSNWKEISSPGSVQNLDEVDNAADVSSISSKSDLPEDTPSTTHAVIRDHNIFGIGMMDFRGGITGSSHPSPSSSSSKVPPRRKRFMHGRSGDRTPDPQSIYSDKEEVRLESLLVDKIWEWINLSKNLINKVVNIDDVNNSGTTEQENNQIIKSNEENGSASAVRQEVVYEVPTNSSSSTSPRSVLSQKAMVDQASSSSPNKEMQLNVQQSNIEDVVQETLYDESKLDIKPQNNQPLDDSTVEEPNDDLSHSQEHNHSPENFIQESKSDDNNEGKLIPLTRKDDSAEPSIPAGVMASRDLLDDKETLNSQMQASSSQVNRESEDKSQPSITQEATKEPLINFEASDTNYTKDVEGERKDLNKSEVTGLSELTGENHNKNELDKSNHASEELNLLQKVVDDMKQEKLDTNKTSLESPKDVGGEHKGLNKNEASVSLELLGESDNINELARSNHTLEEVNLIQQEQNQKVEDHMEQEKLDTDKISEKSSVRKITNVIINAEEKLLESDNGKNESKVLSESTNEADEVSNTENEKA
ncbi:hypothetical protein PIB30_076320 [Stylosanthes scabra]|uniref:Uncharacterized protein n=1 Tax=Stylosanthes scabra TaxID=79078 RepID=A0ABU6VTN8_9FABA|nr:hypothetical protein [Stylosanthes scabra]